MLFRSARPGVLHDLAEAGIVEWVRAAAADRARIANERLAGEQAERLATIEASLEAERAKTRELSDRLAEESRDRVAVVTAWEGERRERDRLAGEREEERRRHQDAIAALSREIRDVNEAREAESLRLRATIGTLEGDLTTLAARIADERHERGEAAAARERIVQSRLAADEALRRDLEENLAARTRDLALLTETRDAELVAHRAELQALERDLAEARTAAERREAEFERTLEGLRAGLDAEREAVRQARHELSLATEAHARAEGSRHAAEAAARDQAPRGSCPDREAALAAQLQAEREVFEALRQDLVARLDAALDAAAAA